MHPQGIGKSILRREDRALLTGNGLFVADIHIDGMRFCAFLRSPHAHAYIKSIQFEDAITAPGVSYIFTGKDLQIDGVKQMIPLWLIPGIDQTTLVDPPRWSIALDKVRHVGEIVAVVIADTAHNANDAIEKIQVEYEILEAVVDLNEAIKPEAPQIHTQAPLNTALRFERGSNSAVAEAFTKAKHVVTVDIVNHRLVCAALEPRAAVAKPSASINLDGHALTLWSSTQIPHLVRKLISEQLNINENSVRVIAPDVGGGFGTKGKLYPEEVILSWAAIKTRKPLKWVSTRSEAFVSDYQGRDHFTQAQIALDEQGLILGLNVKTLASLGAYVSTVGAAVPTTVYTAVLSGPYKIPAIYAQVSTVFTNTVPTDAYRGAGRPEACFVLERLLEEAAIQTGIERMELRRKNFISATEMPYSTPIGPVYDSGDFAKLFDRALVASDYLGFESRRKSSKEKGMIRGFGICYFIESSGVAPSKPAGLFGSRAGLFESADIRVAADGSLLVMCGTHNHGQAHSTTYAQLLASKLGVPLSMIEIVEGDTGRVPYGTGTFGSRSMVVAGSAILLAADKIILKSQKLAAHILGCATDAITHQVNGEKCEFISTNGKSVTWYQLAKAITCAHDLPVGMEPVLHENAFYDPSNFTWSNGAQTCELEIDPHTGITKILSYFAVDDAGTIINPMVVQGQTQGGVAQGIGQALFEEVLYDSQTGQLSTGSFMDYTMPRADMMPNIETETDESQPCRHNPSGVKGCGESGTIGAPAAIASAMLDALNSIGVSGVEMPYQPMKVWRAISKSNYFQQEPK